MTSPFGDTSDEYSEYAENYASVDDLESRLRSVWNRIGPVRKHRTITNSPVLYRLTDENGKPRYNPFLYSEGLTLDDYEEKYLIPSSISRRELSHEELVEEQRKLELSRIAGKTTAILDVSPVEKARFTDALSEAESAMETYLLHTVAPTIFALDSALNKTKQKLQIITKDSEITLTRVNAMARMQEQALDLGFLSFVADQLGLPQDVKMMMLQHKLDVLRDLSMPRDRDLMRSFSAALAKSKPPEPPKDQPEDE